MSRSPRQEFRKSVQAEIKARAVDEHGVRRCECCGCLVRMSGEVITVARAAQVDHKAATWTASATPVRDRPRLTAADGWLLCDACHKAKTRREAAERAKTDGAAKQHAAHLAVMAAKCGGDIEKVSKTKKKWPTQNIKSRGFPTKEKRKLFKETYHHEAE